MSRQNEDILQREVARLLAVRDAARTCRASQKYYFKNRTQENLVAAKQAEAALDKLLT